MSASDEELLADLRDVAASLNKTTVGSLAYRNNGKFADTTLSRRFGSWNEPSMLPDYKLRTSPASPTCASSRISWLFGSTMGVNRAGLN